MVLLLHMYLYVGFGSIFCVMLTRFLSKFAKNVLLEVLYDFKLPSFI